MRLSSSKQGVILFLVTGLSFTLGANLPSVQSIKGSASLARIGREITDAIAHWTKAKNSTSSFSTFNPIFSARNISNLSIGSQAFFKDSENYQKPRYSPGKPPLLQTFPSSNIQPSLASIVKGMLNILKEQGYPTNKVAISLLDLQGKCCDYAGYRDREKQYPASVVKLFWLVALYGYYKAGILQPNTVISRDDEELMVHYSSNGASSRVVDALTQTESGGDLNSSEFILALQARNQLNEFFQLAGYEDINIAHKTFPIPDLGLDERMGWERQFAEGAYQQTSNLPSSRNYLTTKETARLLYEIATDQAISPQASQQFKKYLQHSTDPAIWQLETPNAIQDSFGERLPPDVRLFTKLGYTFNDGRQEAAIIESADGKTRFVLVVFANDPVFSTEGSSAFPAIARYAFDQMNLRISAP